MVKGDAHLLQQADLGTRSSSAPRVRPFCALACIEYSKRDGAIRWRVILQENERSDEMSEHLVLVGDSIFDNSAYTAGEPDVIHHLHQRLPRSWRSSLLAVDGSMTHDLGEQVARVPSDATRLIVSIGGNDVLQNIDILDLPVRSTREALSLFDERITQFEKDYRTAIQIVAERGLPLMTCTVYNGNLGPDEAPTARIALMLFNDVVLRVAFERRLRVIDLRLVCCSPSDYANPIEPSGSGGRKIAEAIARALAEREEDTPARVYAG